jgi:hypothetical protein
MLFLFRIGSKRETSKRERFVRGRLATGALVNPRSFLYPSAFGVLTEATAPPWARPQYRAVATLC